eukprot:SAG25_NODE_12671_length_276_cov_2.553672_1_plen_74_part_10
MGVILLWVCVFPRRSQNTILAALLLALEAENRLIGHPAPPQDECLTGWDVAPGMRHTIPPPPPPPPPPPAGPPP